jgi:putative Mn2+ efflux pump MntP
VGIAQYIIIACGLAMDATAVCLGTAATGRITSRRAGFRLVFHFGLFQMLMPLLGWLLGRGLVGIFVHIDHWLAMGLLAFVGIRMIIAGASHHDEETPRGDPSKGWSLVALSVATSVDALAVGLGLAVLDISIWLPCLLIGVITAAMSWGGLKLGGVLHARWGNRMEMAGGALLVLIDRAEYPGVTSAGLRAVRPSRPGPGPASGRARTLCRPAGCG